MLMKLNPIVLEALENGIPLMGEEVFKQLKDTFNEMKERGLRRTKVSWIAPA